MIGFIILLSRAFLRFCRVVILVCSIRCMFVSRGVLSRLFILFGLTGVVSVV